MGHLRSVTDQSQWLSRHGRIESRGVPGDPEVGEPGSD